MGLVAAIISNPDMADQTASVTGAVVGLIALVVSIATFVRISGVCRLPGVLLTPDGRSSA